ncbi:MAG: S-layer homology domain-containing protein [Peptococcaceae bacterium]|nr:S-layer homology domain-containing protein [Peptococcaceae bacterium]
MKKSIFLKFIKASVIFLSIYIIVMSSTSALASDSFEFSDATGHWAAENIAQCAAFQLMKGYPEGEFKPEQSLSKAEALLVIGKSLGWDKTTNSFAPGIVFPTDIWPGFKEYIALAAEKGLINKADIAETKFNQPASRIELATWIAKALRLSGDGNALNFADISLVPQADRSLLAGAVDQGILVGLPGNVFAPEKSLSRAEMSSILVRMVESGRINAFSGRMLSGTVKDIDWLNKIISIDLGNGENKSFDLGMVKLVYRKGVKTYPGDTTQGDVVKLVLDATDRCVMIVNQTEKNILPVIPLGDGAKGYIVNKYLDYFTVHLEYGDVQQVASRTPVSYKGYPSNYGFLSKGNYVELNKSGNEVVSVNIIDDTKKVFGSVQSVNDYQISLKDDDDKSSIFDVINNPRITDNDGERVFLDDLNNGDYIEIILDSYGKVKEIKVGIDSANDLEGRVSSIRISGEKRIVIKDNDEESHTYSMSDSVRVDGLSSNDEITDINIGMWVKLTLDSNGEVRNVEIIGEDVLEGQVTGIWNDSRKIRIEKSDGEEKTYYISDVLSVFEGSTSRTLNSIEDGDWVRLYLNSDLKVSRIEIMAGYSVEGTVDYLALSGTEKIRIKQSNGDLKTYYLNEDVLVRENSTSRSLSYLEKDMYVKLDLNTDEEVTRIDILDDTDVNQEDLEGKIFYIQPIGNERMLEIITDNGTQGRYYFAKNLTIAEDGESKSLNYLLKGMDVSLTLNGSGDITRIDIDKVIGNTYVSGEVVYIERTGSQWIMDIIDDNNRSLSYYFGSDTDIRQGSDDLNISDIEENMYLQITLDEEENVIRIDVFGTSQLEGEVTYFSSSSKRIEIKKAGEDEEVYFLADRVTVIENGNTKRLRDVYKGLEVRLTFNLDDEITRIELIGTSFVEGVVNYVRTVGVERIEIENRNNDNVEMYDLLSTVEVLENDLVRGLEDIDPGDNVVLILDDRNRVIKIEL